MYIHTYITDHFLASLHSNFDAQFLNLQILSGLPTCLSTLSGSFLSPSCRISLNMFKHMLFKIDRNSHICYRYLHMQFLVNDLSFFIDQTDKSLATSHIVRLFLWTGFHATHTVSRQKKFIASLVSRVQRSSLHFQVVQLGDLGVWQPTKPTSWSHCSRCASSCSLS